MLRLRRSLATWIAAAAAVTAVTIFTIALYPNSSLGPCALRGQNKKGFETLCKAFDSRELKQFGFSIIQFNVTVRSAPKDKPALEQLAKKVIFNTVVPTKKKHRADVLTDDLRSEVLWKPILRMEPVSAYWPIFGAIASQMVYTTLPYSVDGERHILDPGDQIVKVTMRGQNGKTITTFAIFSQRGTLKYEFYIAWKVQWILDPKTLKPESRH